MNARPTNILLVEDEPAHAAAIRRAFENAGSAVNICEAGTLREFRLRSMTEPPDIAVMDLNLPDGRAVDVLSYPPENGTFPILLMTSFGNEHVAVEAIKGGALDYIVKSPESFLEMPHTVERALREWNLLRERQRLKEQLLQAQKMEAIGQLAGGVAHDLNNILMVIYGYCSAMQIKLGTDSPYTEELDHIYGAAERAANLTRSLLAFSRKQIMVPKQVNLNDIVMNIGKLLVRIIGEDIRFKTVSSGTTIMIYADSSQIEQVLMNLAANARDAMPGGGVFAIETGVRDVDDEFINSQGSGIPGKYAVISVSDSGKGMDADTAKKIFEPFFTTKEVGRGTGLGLAIAYGVIKQHNGFITVKSKPGGGSTFTIYLPLLLGGAALEQETNGLDDYPLHGSETVLVVEDDPSIRILSEGWLTKLGYNVILASDGVEAVEKFKANPDDVDIIIMDMIMPNKSGREAFEEIRRLSPSARVIFISGYSPDLLQNRGFLSKGEEVITKPVQPFELARKMRRVLDGSEVDTPSDKYQPLPD